MAPRLLKARHARGVGAAFNFGVLMKKLMLACLVASSAFAAPAKPLLMKSSGGGFVPPDYARHEKCEVYSDRVVLTHRYGSGSDTALQLVETRTITLNGNVALVIEKAAAEAETTKPNNLCDGPGTGIVAYDKNGQDVSLFSTGGCGSPQRSRDGVQSSKLKSIVDLFCSQTYKFADPE